MAQVPKMVVHVNDDAYWRRHYAGLAMQALIQFDWNETKTAEMAVTQADALLAELKKREATDAQ